MTTSFGSPVSGTIEQAGPAVTRWSAGQDAAPTVNPLTEAWQVAKVVGGTLRHGANPNGSQEDSSSFARFDVLPNAQHGPGIMGTLQGSGYRQSVEIEPGNPASRTSLESAIRMGLVIPAGAPRDAFDAAPAARGSVRRA